MENINFYNINNSIENICRTICSILNTLEKDHKDIYELYADKDSNLTQLQQQISPNKVLSYKFNRDYIAVFLDRCSYKFCVNLSYKYIISDDIFNDLMDDIIHIINDNINNINHSLDSLNLEKTKLISSLKKVEKICITNKKKKIKNNEMENKDE